MTSALTLDALKAQVGSGDVDTVLMCFVDMQGRLMGKRFHAYHFIEGGWGKRTAATTCWPPTLRWQRQTAMPAPPGRRAMATT